MSTMTAQLQTTAIRIPIGGAPGSTVTSPRERGYCKQAHPGAHR